VRALATQFTSFALVGVFGAIAHYGTLIALAEGAGADPVLASACGFVAGGLTNYVLNYRFTFRSGKQHSRALPQFFAVALVGLAFNTGLMALFVNVAGVHYLPAQIGTTGLLTLWHFGANRFWTFR
jgi:putative flippase GtrA